MQIRKQISSDQKKLSRILCIILVLALTFLLIVLEVRKKSLYIIDKICYVAFIHFIPENMAREIFTVESLDGEQNLITKTIVTEQQKEDIWNTQSYICWNTEKYTGNRFPEYPVVYKTKLLILAATFRMDEREHDWLRRTLIFDLPINAVLYTAEDEKNINILGIILDPAPYYIQNASISLDLEEDTNVMSDLYFVRFKNWSNLTQQYPWQKDFDKNVKETDYLANPFTEVHPEWLDRHYALKTKKSERLEAASNKGYIARPYGIDDQSSDYIHVKFEVGSRSGDPSLQGSLTSGNRLPQTGLAYRIHFSAYEAGGSKIEENEIKGRVPLKFKKT